MLIIKKNSVDKIFMVKGENMWYTCKVLSDVRGHGAAADARWGTGLHHGGEGWDRLRGVMGLRSFGS